jgi:phosphoglycolate phosphatase-like HAD superfamily hydrolase
VLVLWDIDGTLMLGAHEQHREAVHDALREVLGIRDPAAPRVEAAGRTDLAIARDIALESGLSAERVEDSFDDLRAACCDAYARRCPPDMRSYVAPGIPDLLERVEAAGARQALLTGNLEPIARLKMSRAGLARYFPRGQGAFGSDSVSRPELPPIARARAGRDGTPYPRADTILVGDTPRDVACARADGIRCLAIATGAFRADDLGDADGVAADAAQLGALLERELSAGAA